MATTPDQVLKWAFSLNPFSLGSSCSSKKTFWLIQDSAKDNSRSFTCVHSLETGTESTEAHLRLCTAALRLNPLVSLASSLLTLSSRPPWT